MRVTVWGKALHENTPDARLCLPNRGSILQAPRRRRPVLRFWPLVLLTTAVLAFTACEDAQEVVPSATVPAQTPVQNSPTQTPVPSPAAGYKWWTAPPLSAEAESLGLRRYTLQIPADFSEPPGPYLGNPATFVPATGVNGGFPYAPVPQLTILTAHPSEEFPHPFVSQAGQQMGGGCSGDVSNHSATPSGQTVAGAFTWDTYVFLCGQTHVGYEPGSSYDGRAAEAQIGDTILAVITFEPVGSGSMRAAFEQAISSITLQ